MLNRKFVGKFEDMYRLEKIQNFDSWQQDDTRHFSRKVALDILDGFNFGRILDIGCGKGMLTHRLKKNNNHVVGLDVSPTAIEVARSRYLDIDFEVVDVNNLTKLRYFLDENYGCVEDANMKNIDLVFAAECLSYIENWKGLIQDLAQRTSYLMITLYIPNNPVGYVKSSDEIEFVVSNNFEILEVVSMKNSQSVILFARSA
jgi:2-polyprenyl-3-methyl-5-hydroxy-6-metoxy-1,4-benzoquinol methylase